MIEEKDYDTFIFKNENIVIKDKKIINKNVAINNILLNEKGRAKRFIIKCPLMIYQEPEFHDEKYVYLKCIDTIDYTSFYNFFSRLDDYFIRKISINSLDWYRIKCNLNMIDRIYEQTIKSKPPYIKVKITDITQLSNHLYNKKVIPYIIIKNIKHIESPMSCCIELSLYNIEEHNNDLIIDLKETIDMNIKNENITEFLNIDSNDINDINDSNDINDINDNKSNTIIYDNTVANTIIHDVDNIESNTIINDTHDAESNNIIINHTNSNTIINNDDDVESNNIINHTDTIINNDNDAESNNNIINHTDTIINDMDDAQSNNNIIYNTESNNNIIHDVQLENTLYNNNQKNELNKTLIFNPSNNQNKNNKIKKISSKNKTIIIIDKLNYKK